MGTSFLFSKGLALAPIHHTSNPSIAKSFPFSLTNNLSYHIDQENTLFTLLYFSIVFLKYLKKVRNKYENEKSMSRFPDARNYAVIQVISTDVVIPRYLTFTSLDFGHPVVTISLTPMFLQPARYSRQCKLGIRYYVGLRGYAEILRLSIIVDIDIL